MNTLGLVACMLDKKNTQLLGKKAQKYSFYHKIPLLWGTRLLLKRAFGIQRQAVESNLVSDQGRLHYDVIVVVSFYLEEVVPNCYPRRRGLFHSQKSLRKLYLQVPTTVTFNQ